MPTGSTRKKAPPQAIAEKSLQAPPTAFRENFPGRGRPRIVHLMHRLDVAGAEVLAAALSRQLSSRYDFVFCCLDGVGALGEALGRDGFEIIDLQRRPGLDLRLALRLKRILAQQRIDLVHAHQYTPFFYAAAARMLGVHPPILFTEHGRHYPDSRKRRRILANRLLLRTHDRVTAVGAFIKQALCANEGLSADRIEVAYNGVDAASWSAAPNSRERMRRSLGLSPTTPVVLQVARFAPVKDHATSLCAFAMVADQQPNAVLLLVGDGPQQAPMRQLADQLGLSSRVRFLGVRNDVAELMSASDVFVLSSLSEGVSVTLLEAMSARLPICATDVGGNGEVVIDQQTGLLSPRRDSAALATNILQLLDQPNLRWRLSTAGFARVLQVFSQQRMHTRYAELYDAMLGKETATSDSPIPYRLAG